MAEKQIQPIPDTSQVISEALRKQVVEKPPVAKTSLVAAKQDFIIKELKNLNAMQRKTCLDTMELARGMVTPDKEKIIAVLDYGIANKANGVGSVKLAIKLS